MYVHSFIHSFNEYFLSIHCAGTILGRQGSRDDEKHVVSILKVLIIQWKILIKSRSWPYNNQPRQCFEGKEHCPMLLLNQGSWPRFLDLSWDGAGSFPGRSVPAGAGMWRMRKNQLDEGVGIGEKNAQARDKQVQRPWGGREIGECETPRCRGKGTQQGRGQ